MLTDEQIIVFARESGFVPNANPNAVNALGKLVPAHWLSHFARAIEAEVRKQDEALIRQMLEALENLDGIDTETECVTIHVQDEITAARARLGEGVV